RARVEDDVVAVALARREGAAARDQDEQPARRRREGELAPEAALLDLAAVHQPEPVDAAAAVLDEDARPPPERLEAGEERRARLRVHVAHDHRPAGLAGPGAA